MVMLSKLLTDKTIIVGNRMLIPKLKLKQKQKI